MNKPADFYLFQGDGNFVVVSTLRACRKIGTVEHNGRTITLVNVDPPIQAGILVPGVRNDVLGMSSYGPKHFDRLTSGETAQAVLWEVYDFGGSQYASRWSPRSDAAASTEVSRRSTPRATSWKPHRPQKPSSTRSSAN